MIITLILMFYTLYWTFNYKKLVYFIINVIDKFWPNIKN